MWKIKARAWRQEIKQSPLRLSLNSYLFYVSLKLNLTDSRLAMQNVFFSFINKLMKESHRGQWSHNLQQTEKRDLQWRQESQKAKKWVTSLWLGEGGSMQIKKPSFSCCLSLVSVKKDRKVNLPRLLCNNNILIMTWSWCWWASPLVKDLLVKDRSLQGVCNYSYLISNQ